MLKRVNCVECGDLMLVQRADKVSTVAGPVCDQCLQYWEGVKVRQGVRARGKSRRERALIHGGDSDYDDVFEDM